MVVSLLVDVLQFLQLLLEVVPFILEVYDIRSGFDDLGQGFIQQVQALTYHHVDDFPILRSDYQEHIFDIQGRIPD